jgi:hypothetical protein
MLMQYLGLWGVSGLLCRLVFLFLILLPERELNRKLKLFSWSSQNYNQVPMINQALRRNENLFINFSASFLALSII